MSNLIAEKTLSTDHNIRIHCGDLTLEKVDAIVNAANSHLSHGGGVAGAIVARGGIEIQRESDQWIKKHGLVATGEVAVTNAGSLPCRFIIHAVGPVWHGGSQGEDELLYAAITHSLEKAQHLGLKSIAIPAISSGIFGFPKERNAQIIIRAVLDFCRNNPASVLREIRLTNIDPLTSDLLKEALIHANETE